MRRTKIIILFVSLFFLGALALLNGVVFTVSRVEVHCYNITGEQVADDEFNARVLSAADIKTGQSILFMSTQNPENRISAAVVDAEVINIERVFPNLVRIIVVKHYAHAYIQNGESYLIVDERGKIFYDDVESLDDERAKCDGKNLIELKISGEISGEAGQTLVSSDGGVSLYIELLDSFAWSGYKWPNIVALIDNINIISDNEIIIETVGNDNLRGTVFKLLDTVDMRDKINVAVSYYLGDGDNNRTEKLITLVGETSTVVDRP